MIKIQKVSEVKDLREEMKSASVSLLDLRIKRSTTMVRDTSQFKKLKKYIAKLNTQLKQKGK